jgi:hypothetical protein
MKTYKFKRIQSTGRVVTTRIKAESREEAWEIFEQKYDPSSLLVQQ